MIHNSAAEPMHRIPIHATPRHATPRHATPSMTAFPFFFMGPRIWGGGEVRDGTYLFLICSLINSSACPPSIFDWLQSHLLTSSFDTFLSFSGDEFTENFGSSLAYVMVKYTYCSFFSLNISYACNEFTLKVWYGIPFLSSQICIVAQLDH